MAHPTNPASSDASALVTFLRFDDVARITLNDPASRNALSVDMAHELVAQLDRAERECRAVVLTGAAGGFCSGAKLGAGGDKAAGPPDLGQFLLDAYNPLLRKVRELQVPLVVAVNGAAAGIGCSLALAGDIIVAAEDAFFLQAFSRIGLAPDGGSAFLVAHAAGRVRAMEMALLDDKLDARQALDWGLVTRVVAPDALLATADALAQRLAQGPTVALGQIRQLVWGACEARFNDQLDQEARVQTMLGKTPDHGEGVRAFMEKRRPAFTGKQTA